MNKLKTYLAFTCLTFIAGCASPPLKYYTFTEAGNPSQTSNVASNIKDVPVLYIARINVPDYLNTTDITIRNGNALSHSINGRMSSILSVSATDLIMNRLSIQNQNLWITKEAPVTTPNYQLMVNVSRFDLQALNRDTGHLSIEATWSIVPHETHLPMQKYRTSFVENGSIKTDADIVQLEQNALLQLTDRMNQTIHQLQ